LNLTCVACVCTCTRLHVQTKHTYVRICVKTTFVLYIFVYIFLYFSHILTRIRYESSLNELISSHSNLYNSTYSFSYSIRVLYNVSTYVIETFLRNRVAQQISAS